jgi:sarcosine oxidase
VLITSGSQSWTFDCAIISSGGWSRKLMPTALHESSVPHRNYLTWFAARDPSAFAPDQFPIFIRISGERSMYGAPSVDGATVKATLDGRSSPAVSAESLRRELTPAEILETTETVTEFFPGLYPDIVRADAYPDLHTSDGHPLLGHVGHTGRIYCATGFSGAGFKMASGYGEIAAHEALGKQMFDGLDFVRPQRFGAP